MAAGRVYPEFTVIKAFGFWRIKDDFFFQNEKNSTETRIENETPGIHFPYLQPFVDRDILKCIHTLVCSLSPSGWISHLYRKTAEVLYFVIAMEE